MKKRLRISFYFIVLLFCMCEPDLELPFEVYTIKKGKHASTLKIQSLQTSHLKFSAVFDHSAIYQSLTAENQHDINKLIGFSDCNSHHQTNSARFGWRWLDEQLEILAYCYVDGERIAQHIGLVELDEENEYELKITDQHYVFELSGAPSVYIERGDRCRIGVYYMLFPYFGGDEVAPHDVSIKVRVNY